MARSIIICLAILGAFSCQAHAHVVSGPTDSFADGIAHPLSGLDHIFSMIAAGLLAALSGKRAIWVWLGAFLTAMFADLVSDSLGLCVHFGEPAVAFSIILLGLILVFAERTQILLGAAMMALLAFIHSHDYAACSKEVQSAAYLAGFAIATMALYAGGAALGQLLSVKGRFESQIICALGLFTIAGGVAMLAGLV